MINFDYQCATEIIFGRKTHKEVGKHLKKIGNKVLLVHTGDPFMYSSGLYDTIVRSLEENGLEYVELKGIKPNPSVKKVREGIQLCREEKVEVLLGVGGGSAIDTAKAISFGVYYEGDVWDFFVGKAKISKVMPLGVVLTIPATGTEASDGCVLTNEDVQMKRNAPSDLNRPAFSILNPELTYTLPPYMTACGGIDMMTHVIERYFTKTKNVDLTDRLCEAVLKTVIRNLPIVLAEPDNYDARAEIMWSGTVAHNGLLGTGREETWASHKVGNEIAAIYDLPHGATLAIAFPAWASYVYKYDIPRFAKYAIRVWGVEDDEFNQEAVALEGIRRTKEFFRAVGAPVSLADAGIPEDRIEEMAEKCCMFGPVGGGFLPLDKEDVINIYKLALR